MLMKSHECTTSVQLVVLNDLSQFLFTTREAGFFCLELLCTDRYRAKTKN